jgi:hypothetical protein
MHPATDCHQSIDLKSKPRGFGQCRVGPIGRFGCKVSGDTEVIRAKYGGGKFCQSD